MGWEALAVVRGEGVFGEEGDGNECRQVQLVLRLVSVQAQLLLVNDAVMPYAQEVGGVGRVCPGW